MAFVVESKLALSSESPGFMYSCGHGPCPQYLSQDAFVSKWILASQLAHSSKYKKHLTSTNSDKSSPRSPASVPTRPRAVFLDQIKSQNQRCLACNPRLVWNGDRTGLDPCSCSPRRRAYSEKPIFRADALSRERRDYVNYQSQLFTWRRERVKKRVDSFKLDGTPISERYKQFLCNDACFYYQNEWRLGRVHQPLEKKIRKCSSRNCVTA